MIDLVALKRSAEMPGESAVVSRNWLRQVLAEITAGRDAQARAGHCFGLPPGKTL